VDLVNSRQLRILKYDEYTIAFLLAGTDSMTIEPTKTTHFGFRDVPIEEKSSLVANVFRSVAGKYDLMNDVMSLGMHRLWKQFTLAQANVRPHDQILDVASGTGDLAHAFAKIIQAPGLVTMSDINDAMLTIGRDRLVDAGFLQTIRCIQADAECLPFIDNHFDLVTIAFGLRNVTDKTSALKSLYRVLKPGGKLLVLEFSHPTTALLSKLYDLYSFKMIPALGEKIANDRDSYQYLVESIRKHPNQDTLKAMLIDAGFEDVEYYNLSGGIVALHKGYKY